MFDDFDTEVQCDELADERDFDMGDDGEPDVCDYEYRDDLGDFNQAEADDYCYEDEHCDWHDDVQEYQE